MNIRQYWFALTVIGLLFMQTPRIGEDGYYAGLGVAFFLLGCIALVFQLAEDFSAWTNKGK